jgi:dihydrodipicolinate synthase/N-acetylneuraminate lyase
MSSTTQRGRLKVHELSLTRQSLRGVWPALLTPWTDDDQVDEGRLADEIEFFAAAGVHGTYTGGTAGEFYAQDDATFSKLTRTACRAAQAANLPIQIGCTGLCTKTVKSRIRVALEHGADAIQLALPFWLALTDLEVLQFFHDVAEVAGSTPLVLYQTMRTKRRVDPPLIGTLCREIPTLIGIKDTGCDYQTIEAILADAPGLSVFGTDVDFMERMLHGACGTYSSVAGLNPRLMLAIYKHSSDGQFDRAAPLQDAVRRLVNDVIHPIGQDGLMDSALDRLQRVVGGGNVGLRCQPPYSSASSTHVEQVRRWCEREAPILLAQADAAFQL